MIFSLFISSALLIANALGAPLTARDSSEALDNIQYLTKSWQSYTTSLINISSTYRVHEHHHFNASTLPLETQYAIIAIESSYNMNFKYESYPIERIAAGPVLNKTDSKAVVAATKEMVHALRPLFEAFEPFVDLVGKDNIGFMLGYQSIVGDLIAAVETVVQERQKNRVERQKVKHAKIVEELKADLLDCVR